MRVLNPNPEEEEYLHPGDMLEMLTDMSIYVFDIPTPGRRGESRSIITLDEGDLIEYIGVVARRGPRGVMYLFKFIFISLDEEGEVLDRIPFFIKNVESLLKWTEIVE